MVAAEAVRPRILIVEDDRGAAEELQVAIGDVADGEIWTGSLLRRDELVNYDGLILDLRLGEMTGIDALRAMEGPGEFPWIVLVSGAETRLVRMFADVARAKGFTIVDQFAKPVDIGRLRTALSRGPVAVGSDAVGEAEMTPREIVAGFYAGALDIFFQPVIGAADGSCVGVEALVRWMGPCPGRVPAAPRIIAAIVDEGLADLFDGWLVERCTRTAIEFQRTLGPIRVSLNIASARIPDRNMLKILRVAAARVKQAGGRLCIEITEQGPSEISAEIEEAVAALRLMDCDVALDDYGTGVSNFDRIGHLAVSELKIDRMLLAEARRSPAAETHLAGLVQFCHERGVEVVLEGVETKEDVALAARIGVDLLQGFFFAMPMPKSEFTKWYEKQAQK